jgi:flagellar biosynthesis/type III secretory pathway protein FliH
MARVIKGGAAGGARPARPAARVLAQADQKKVIDRALYVARQEAEELLRAADDERKAILAEGRRLAAQAREEAMVRGASESFARAAEEALEAFRKRGDRYSAAADDIRILALEIVRKVLGAEPDIAGKDVEKILDRGLAHLRARRRLRVQLPTGRPEELRFERPNLMKAVAAQPDLVVEEADDVRLGFARVVTEVGGALCAEQSALDAVALAVNVRESPRPRDERPTSGTSSPAGVRTDARVLSRGLATGDGSASEVGADTPTAPVTRDRERTMRLPATGRPAAPPLARTAPHDELPDANVELDSRGSSVRDDDDSDDDATRALPGPAGRSRPDGRLGARALPAPTPRVADRSNGLPSGGERATPLASREQRAERDGIDRAVRDRVPTGMVQAGGKSGSRVVHVDARGAVDDDDLDLYTDAAPPRRR